MTHNAIHYREMLPNDYEEVLSLWSGDRGISIPTKELMNQYLEHNKSMCFVAYVHTDIIATISMGFDDGKYGILRHLFVHEKHRKHGVANHLIKLALNALKEHGASECRAFCFSDNTAGLKFWNDSSWEKRDDLTVFSTKL